jgi:hypothetical protein
MFQPYKAIRQHIYEEFDPTAHYSNILFSYVFIIFFLYFILTMNTKAHKKRTRAHVCNTEVAALQNKI